MREKDKRNGRDLTRNRIERGERSRGNKGNQFPPFQLLEHQMVWWVCRLRLRPWLQYLCDTLVAIPVVAAMVSPSLV